MPSPSSRHPRAVLVIWDSLRADLTAPEWSPRLARARAECCEFLGHRSVFPSTTRTASASIATGCLPGRHGLHGNSMALDEGAGLVCLSTGKADFRDRLCKATGRTLLEPALPQRLAGRGGCIVFSNSSPGSAAFQDPDGYGYLYNRAGSFGPGRRPLPDTESLTALKGIPGDRDVTDRFCEEVLKSRQPALSVLWLSEPDHTGHFNPLGGPAHREAVAAADRCFAQVLESVDRYMGRDTLVLSGSDHGQETTERVIPIEELLVSAGLKASLDSSDVVVAPQGTAALVYLDARAASRLDALRNFFEGREWAASVMTGRSLAAAGLKAHRSLALALSLRKSSAPNAFGIPGTSVLMLDRKEDLNHVGCGQHGGLGEWEMRPFLFVRGAGFSPGSTYSGTSCVTDIAPTILHHLGLPAHGMDGSPLQLRVS